MPRHNAAKMNEMRLIERRSSAISRITCIAIALLAASVGQASAQISAKEPARSPGEWLQRNAHAVRLEGDNFSDLEFLRPLLEGKRVVQLGENTHGAREYNRIKSRIVRFLHRELGYDVLAFESPVYQCYDADLTAASAPAIRTLTSCLYGTWHTPDVLSMFEYLRDSRAGERPLTLAGFDVQPIGPNKDDRPEFLSGTVAAFDSAYGERVFRMDSTFLAVYARGSRERRQFFRSADGPAIAAGYDSLEAFIGSRRPASNEKRAFGIAQRTAASMAWYIRQQSAPTTLEYVERRDEGMAENLAFLLDTLYPDRKVIVWGHNFHLRHDNLAIPPDTAMFPDVAARTMGTWIRKRYGDAVYTVGLYTNRGTAADNSGEPYEIVPASEGSLEALLGTLGSGAYFVDITRAPRSPATAWMDAPISARYNGTTPLSMNLRDQYSAILFIDSVNPRGSLQ